MGDKSTICVKDAIFYCVFFIIQLILHGWLVTVCLFCCVREEEREDLDTSTESKEIERKEQDMDTVTEDEEELGPNKKRQRGNAILNLFVHLHACTWQALVFYSKSINICCNFLLRKQTHTQT